MDTMRFKLFIIYTTEQKCEVSRHGTGRIIRNIPFSPFRDQINIFLVPQSENIT